jgi:NAD(P)-dependent dehydrogenase (short-subunit alcohol dehydrogenase family)
MTSYSDMFSLDGRTAVVTGGSRGIGQAIAKGLHDAGARVLSLARTMASDNEVPRTIRQQVCDVSDIGAFEVIIQDFLANDSLDILINAAGITRPGGSLADFDETIAVNLRAPYFASSIAANLMAHDRGGSIINVTSLAAWRGYPNNPAYVAAKGGLSQLTRALAFDLGSRGIRVNNLVPGYIMTEMTRKSWSDPVIRSERERHTMLGRWGRPEDLVGAAVFLSSRASSYITGQDIVVDGGWLAKGLVS